jgi:hypothetical protein
MDNVKFTVGLKAYALAIVSGLASGYIILFAPLFSSNRILFIIMLILSVLVGFFVLAYITKNYDAEISVERHTEERYNSKINRLDRGHKLLTDYFVAVESGIICGAIIDTAAQIGVHTILEAFIFAGIVAVFVVFCYVIIYGTLLILSWIHLGKRRRLAKSEV